MAKVIEFDEMFDQAPPTTTNQVWKQTELDAATTIEALMIQLPPLFLENPTQGVYV